MDEKVFAVLWPRAEILGWSFTLERSDIVYVTPPDEERKKWGGLWTYLTYKDKVVYVPNWFKAEIARDSTAAAAFLESSVMANDIPSKPPSFLPPPPAKKPGWKRWFMSFIW